MGSVKIATSHIIFTRLSFT